MCTKQTMGVKYLASTLRESGNTPDKLAECELLNGKTIGIDLSVILHKALGTNDGAGEYHLEPPCPNSGVIDKCSRFCGWAKSNNITLKVSVDGRYHPMKEEENKRRAGDRDLAQSELEKFLRTIRHNDDNTDTKKAFQLMKKAARVSEKIIVTAIELFAENNVEVFGAPYESDFQLVYWELIGFTDGTYTVDSDMFAMGSKLIIDLLNFNSARGNCKLLIRDEVLYRIMEGSKDWTVEDVVLFSALSGCDFIPRLFRSKAVDHESLMKKYKDPTNNQSLECLLTEYASGQHWPAGKNKPGRPATDYFEKVKLCMGLMMHAPVAAQDGDGKWILKPMRPLPEDSEWKDIIGFDPLEHFLPVSVEESHTMKTWARTGVALPKIEMPIDPNNSSDRLPHGAYIDFNHMPICVVPDTMLILWLFYHGVPHPKGSSRQELVNQVKRAYDMKQPLDEDRLAITDASTARSYVSFDTIAVLSGVEWNDDAESLLSILRSDSTPQVNAEYINAVFGNGKNGVRERSWLRFVSGHLDIETLKNGATKVEMNGSEFDVNILTMQVTPSMKNVVYNVYIVFSSSGDYIPKLSKCDCPNGWLFCSHTLACFLLIRMIQVQEEWSMGDIISFMPVPIKSLQSVPFAASYIFGELGVSKPGAKKGKQKTIRGQSILEEDEDQDEDPNDRGVISAIAKSLAEVLPGYSSEGIPGYSSVSQSSINDVNDASEETRIMNADTETSTDTKSIDLCAMLNENLRCTSCQQSKVNTAKVTLADLTKYNLDLVVGHENDAATLQKYLRHERLHVMMKEGLIPSNTSIWKYLDHFASHREEQIQRLRAIVEDKDQLEGPQTKSYDANFLRGYFLDDIE